MVKVYRLVLGAVFVLGLAAAGYSQGVAPKIGLINTATFYDDKAGIAKMVSAEKLINVEFARDIKELEDGNAKLAAIAAELQKATPTEANRVALLEKKSEGGTLQRLLEFNTTSLEAKIEQRRRMLHITFDVYNALAEFGKNNNYKFILDIAKVAEGCCCNLENATDITKDFIAFYNARAPAEPLPVK